MPGIESRFICKSTKWIILLEDVELGKTGYLSSRGCHLALTIHCSVSSTPQDFDMAKFLMWSHRLYKVKLRPFLK